MAHPIASLIIPAHNEGPVIGNTLEFLLRDSLPGEFEVIVAANGCTDETAAVARSFGNDVRVVEIDAPSKILALNAGDELAVSFPRIYLDADIRVTAPALRNLVALLETDGGPLVAAPTLSVDMSESSWAVRANYLIWAMTDYRRTEMVGSGLYALSARGRDRFDRFPDIIADDLFIQQLFGIGERAVSAGEFTMKAPRTLRDLQKRSIRVAAGNLQLARRSTPDQATEGAFNAHSRRHLAARVGRTPAMWPAFAVYCFCYAVTHVRAERKIRRGEFHLWERVDSTRCWFVSAGRPIGRAGNEFGCTECVSEAGRHSGPRGA